MTPDVKDRPYHDGLLDYLLMGGSLTLVLGTIITVVTSYYLCYYRKKKRGKMQNVDYNKKSAWYKFIKQHYLIHSTECRFEELRARIHTSLINNPMYTSMPVYEQISPRYIPQTTDTITCIHATIFEGSTQPDLDASNHQVSDQSNYYFIQPVHLQNDLELTDHIIQNVNTSDTTDAVEHNDPIGETSSVNDTADASPMRPNTLHLTLDIGIINNSNGLNDERTQAVVSAASVTEIKQEAEGLCTNDTD